MTLLPVHIIAGVTALASGAVALYAVKGAKLHRKSGMIFVCAMLIMSATGAAITGLKPRPNVATAMQGVLTFYLVMTALLTVRRRVVGFHGIDLAAMLVPLTIAIAYVKFGFEAAQSATGTKYGYPPPLYVIFGTVALVAASGDIRMMRARGLQGTRRIARHLWRMCFGMFIATGSFFLGQAQVIPKPIRVVPMLAILALLPLVIMLYWLARVSFTQRYSRTPRTSERVADPSGAAAVLR